MFEPALVLTPDMERILELGPDHTALAHRPMLARHRRARRLLVTAPAATLVGQRDRALLLLGFAGGLRRSELCALDAEDAL
jgi:site-specific recombinase XerD